MNDQKPLVGVLMGSTSDKDIMTGCVDTLIELDIPHEVRILSAHRTPGPTSDYASSAADRGLEVIIAGAGWAAHLAGVFSLADALDIVVLGRIGVAARSKKDLNTAVENLWTELNKQCAGSLFN